MAKGLGQNGQITIPIDGRSARTRHPSDLQTCTLACPHNSSITDRLHYR